MNSLLSAPCLLFYFRYFLSDIPELTQNFIRVLLVSLAPMSYYLTTLLSRGWIFTGLELHYTRMHHRSS